MSAITLGVGASHSTLMNTHWDKVVHTERAAAFRDSLQHVNRRLRELNPDVAVIIGSNHFRGFWLDLIPSFTMGVGDVIASGESGTPKGPQKTDPVFANQLATHLVEAGSEVAISARLQIDHGQSHAIQYLLDGIDIPVVPLVVNVFAQPLPTIERCATLGRRLADAIEANAEGRKVVVIASGGLSHQLPWPSDWSNPQDDDEEFMVDAWLNGRGEWERYDKRRREIIVAAQPCIFEDFDAQFLADLEAGDLEKYTELSTPELEKIAGNGGQELRTWLVMAAALGFAPGSSLCYSPMPEWLTGMGAALIEPAGGDA
ncbi:2,3-dihydroxyphenylpropionate 1,2-dioxygenase [Flexivirga endophytica]|uniref:2,3-dihydroxyphenylpropionate 1,2-dioxygenase n=1 Tax=Flexivirga endophytica TaxID=1849103 RepID=A0A916SUQ3_9MICO|nr:catechol 1,2-dioxygenase [Flexivirga endophytica]GGB18552.1 2,3-dihydroxyphenylpropionate 1,2-dioxygenase [Flexivirga endophytica]GHB37131.1 2,3-dihydroxyphenylpropionate 1,2-dioxygenase [Flexivirga endophytica]